jgi:hypothetical protein
MKMNSVASTINPTITMREFGITILTVQTE